MTTPSEALGRIVQTWKDGQRILWTYVPELPARDARRAMPWLTVLRWEYDGSDAGGMPTAEENRHMQMLDAALGKIERPGFCVAAYRRIGAGLREFVFYIAQRDAFLEEFNRCVANDRRYPITITFYRDDEWTELRDLINDFTDATQVGRNAAWP
jgi:hypothetical protein